MLRVCPPTTTSRHNVPALVFVIIFPCVSAASDVNSSSSLFLIFQLLDAFRQLRGTVGFQAALHAAGIGFALLTRRALKSPLVFRATGAAIAVAGVVLTIGAIRG